MERKNESEVERRGKGWGIRRGKPDGKGVFKEWGKGKKVKGDTFQLEFQRKMCSGKRRAKKAQMMHHEVNFS